MLESFSIYAQTVVGLIFPVICIIIDIPKQVESRRWFVVWDAFWFHEYLSSKHRLIEIEFKAISKVSLFVYKRFVLIFHLQFSGVHTKGTKVMRFKWTTIVLLNAPDCAHTFRNSLLYAWWKVAAWREVFAWISDFYGKNYFLVFYSI